MKNESCIFDKKNHTFVIAEAGSNWKIGTYQEDLKMAKKLIVAAAEAGAEYAKFQTWSVSRLKTGPWDDDGRREIYIKAELKEDQHFELKEYCDSKSIKFMSSVFSIPWAYLCLFSTDSWASVAPARASCVSRNAFLAAVSFWRLSFASLATLAARLRLV